MGTLILIQIHSWNHQGVCFSCGHRVSGETEGGPLQGNRHLRVERPVHGPLLLQPDNSKCHYLYEVCLMLCFLGCLPLTGLVLAAVPYWASAHRSARVFKVSLQTLAFYLHFACVMLAAIP